MYKFGQSSIGVFIKALTFIILFLLSSNLFAEENFKDKLKVVLEEGFHAVGYDKAREIIFTHLDNENGEVCCVYSDHKCLTTSSVPSATKMNIEHTWPQSRGAKGDAKSDLHHLYPSNTKVNATRANLQFCEVKVSKWSSSVSKQGKNEYGENCFEPPDTHKGNVARSLFYFSVKYNKNINEHEESILRQWNKEDPVDQEEMNRNAKILNYQGNSNLFVVHPELVEQILDF